jgi:hypothetical protein
MGIGYQPSLEKDARPKASHHAAEWNKVINDLPMMADMLANQNPGK